MSDSSNTSSNYSCPEFNDSKLEICVDYQEPNNDAPRFFNSDYQNLSASHRDNRYWEKRRKNNAAAKRSRERRRQHDIAMEQQINELKHEVYLLRKKNLDLENTLKLENKRFQNTHNNINLLNIENTNLLGSFLHHERLSNNNNDDGSTNPVALSLDLQHTVAGKDACDHPKSTTPPLLIPRRIPTSNVDTNMGPMNLQRPLDLTIKTHDYRISPNSSYSLPTLHNYSNKMKSRSSQQDERYWDRRRRNNEAVRKCRQNKKVRLLNSSIHSEKSPSNSNNDGSNSGSISNPVKPREDNLQPQKPQHETQQEHSISAMQYQQTLSQQLSTSSSSSPSFSVCLPTKNAQNSEFFNSGSKIFNLIAGIKDYHNLMPTLSSSTTDSPSLDISPPPPTLILATTVPASNEYKKPMKWKNKLIEANNKMLY